MTFGIHKDDLGKERPRDVQDIPNVQAMDPFASLSGQSYTSKASIA